MAEDKPPNKKMRLDSTASEGSGELWWDLGRNKASFYERGFGS